MKTKINVLYLSHEGGSVGGSTESLLNLIHSVRAFVNPIVVVPVKGEACKCYDELNIEYVVVPFTLSITSKKGLQRLFFFFPKILMDFIVNTVAIRKIASKLKGRQIDIVHSNSSVIGFGNRLSKHLKAKHVWHLRELLNFDVGFKSAIGLPNLRKKIAKTDFVICISKMVSIIELKR